MDVSVHPVRAYRLRQKPAMSLEDLAIQIGTSDANLSRIENGKQQISEDLLIKLVAVTAIPARVLRPDLAKLFVRRGAKLRARAA